MSATIYINEESPGRDEFVEKALSYSIAQVEFNNIPEKVTVINYDTGENYEFLSL